MNYELKNFLKHKRKEMGLSLRDFAILCNISHVHLDNLEKGFDPRNNKEISPTIDTLANIARGLKIPLEDFLRLIKVLPTESPPIKDPLLRMIIEWYEWIDDNEKEFIERYLKAQATAKGWQEHDEATTSLGS